MKDLGYIISVIPGIVYVTGLLKGPVPAELQAAILISYFVGKDKYCISIFLSVLCAMIPVIFTVYPVSLPTVQLTSFHVILLFVVLIWTFVGFSKGTGKIL